MWSTRTCLCTCGKWSQNVHNIHTPRNSDRMRRGLPLKWTLQERLPRKERPLLDTEDYALRNTSENSSRTFCRSTGCRPSYVYQSENAVPMGYTWRDSTNGVAIQIMTQAICVLLPLLPPP